MAGQAPPVTDERDGLIQFMRQQRFVLRTTAYGLTDDQARQAPSASVLSVGGLIKHVTQTERNWMDTIREQVGEDYAGYEAGFVMTDDETLQELLDDYALAAQETEDLVASIADLGQPVPVPPAPWHPKDITHWSVR